MIYTFYSYKGGVGRSMALVNIAELMYEAGLKVLMIDWDLEAPGLEHFFPDNKDQILKTPGIMDMLLAYKEKVLKFNPNSGEAFFPAHDLTDFLIEIHPDPKKEGQLWLLPAGQRTSKQEINYARNVQSFDWIDFYENWEGEIYFEQLRKLFETYETFDVILIDTRTGITDMGGVCTYQLADIVLMFCAPNNQNLEGTLRMIKSFSKPELLKQRYGKKLTVLPIPSRIERIAQLEQVNNFRRKFDDYFKDYLPKISKMSQGFPTELEIPYVPAYAFEEVIAVKEHHKIGKYSPELVSAYNSLLKVLSELLPFNNTTIKAKMEKKVLDFET